MRHNIVKGDMGRNSIAHTIAKSQIPEKYKKLPIIGMGTTSIILDAGDDKVIMLTRDSIKTDWLTAPAVNGLEIGEHLGEFDAHYKIPTIKDMPINIIKMPKLHPLDKQNKKKVKQAIEDWNEVRDDFLEQNNKGFPTSKRAKEREHEAMMQYITQKFADDEKEEHILYGIANFLQNYGAAQYYPDLAPRNFMQDKHGNIVPVDPIVASDIMDAIHNNKKEVARVVHNHEPNHANWWKQLGHDGEKDYLKDHPKSKLKLEANMKVCAYEQHYLARVSAKNGKNIHTTKAYKDRIEAAKEAFKAKPNAKTVSTEKCTPEGLGIGSDTRWHKKHEVITSANYVVKADMGAGRIATSVSKKDIPTKYKDLPIIGMGSTCVVLDAGKDHVIMLTRDHMKSRWLGAEGMKIAKDLGTYDAPNTNPKVAEHPIHILKVKKLQPLSKENKKIAEKVVDEYVKVFNKYKVKHSGMFLPKEKRMDPKKAEQLTIRDTMKHFAENTDAKHVFHKLANFLSRFDPAKDYYDDIHPRNFMQDEKGNILPVDQIVSKDLQDAFQEQKDAMARVTHKGEKAAGKWWPELGREGEKEYLKEHPRSKLKMAASVVEQLYDPKNPNSGHGHIFPRPDGMRSRCCVEKCPICAKDRILKNKVDNIEALAAFK